MKSIFFYIMLLLFLTTGIFAQPAIEWDTKDPQSYFKLGEGMERMGEYEAALEAYIKAIELDPNFMHAYLNRAKVLVRMKREKEALKIFKEVINSQNSDELIKSSAFTSIGIIHYKKEEYETAIQRFVQATKLVDDYAPSWYLLGQAYERIDELEKAADAYRNAVDLAPDNMRYDKALSRVLDDLMW